jgi:hypothetical protein
MEFVHELYDQRHSLSRLAQIKIVEYKLSRGLYYIVGIFRMSKLSLEASQRWGVTVKTFYFGLYPKPLSLGYYF